MANKIIFKRGIHQNLPQPLDVGEPAFTTDTKDFYVGSDTGNVRITKDTISGTDVTNSDTTQRHITGKFVKEEILDKIPKISSDLEVDGADNSKTAGAKAVKDYVASKMASAYKPKGNLAPESLIAALLVAANEGNVYNITGEFTTDVYFIEGAGNVHPAGTNVGIIDVGGGEYKFDALAGFVDTSSFLTAIPQATSSDLGGIKASAKGGGDTVAVKIDTDTGILYVPTYPTDTDTKNTAGSTQDSAKLFIVGAKSQGTNPQTYSNSKVYIDSDKLYSNSEEVVTTNDARLSDARTPTSHTHGSLSNDGKLADNIAPASGLKFVMTDGSDNVKQVNLAFGVGTSKYMREDGTWVTPPNQTYSMMTSSVLGLGKLFSDTEQSVAANAVSSTVNRTYGIQKNANNQLVVNIPWTDTNTDTKNTAGTTQKLSTKMFLVGAESQGDNPQTYSNSGVYIGTDNKLYSNSKEVVITDDARLSDARTPTSHTHGSLSNDGKLTTNTTKASGFKFVMTDSDNNIKQINIALGNGTTNFMREDGAWATPTFTAPIASPSVLGGVKVGYTTSTPKHKVELDVSNNAFVDLTNLTVDGGEWE